MATLAGGQTAFHVQTFIQPLRPGGRERGRWEGVQAPQCPGTESEGWEPGELPVRVRRGAVTSSRSVVLCGMEIKISARGSREDSMGYRHACWPLTLQCQLLSFSEGSQHSWGGSHGHASP